MKNYIPKSVRLKVAKRALFCCEYCLFPEIFSDLIFHIDHIESRKHGGTDSLENYAYSCPDCNGYKGTDISTFSNADKKILIPFFNPRKDIWKEHFEIFEGQILGFSDIGEATTKIFKFNQIERLIFRRQLIEMGVFNLELK